MIPEPLRRKSRRALSSIEPQERRGWLTHGIAALTVSALGLAVAGSVALNTSAAESGGAPVIAARSTVSQSQNSQVAVPGMPQVQSKGEASSFDRRNSEAQDPSRSQDRALQAKERSASREESLARDAEAALKAAYEETMKRRTKDLDEAEKESYENAARIARERAESAARRAAEQRDQNEDAPSSSDDGSVDDSDNAGPPVGGGGSASPVPGAVVGAYFGQTGLWARYHTGLDFRAGSGTPIKAVKAGTVLHAGYGGNAGSWAGNYVAIKHADGNTTLYAHMSSNSVSPGQQVPAGKVIGHVGSTGRAFGAHLHFELYKGGARYGDVYSASNPQPWLNAIGVNTN
ncbi:M23 family metallopeptidase [Microlunatus speluncae]|uniref:M23 family metallopeptidase n=1 Tax=Microlunatus speluncae TaxID=2594267 RepID=UPI00126641C9|nr:M23 family metallopeptidase [Microlunatus speluncae]